MKEFQQIIANWAQYPSVYARVSVPENNTELTALVQQPGALLARGNGRCYGDAALHEHVVSTLSLNQIIDFDPVNGEITCQSGVLLQQVLDLTLPHGWFFHVTPGIKLITVGGAVASDVHGKNHPVAGCFSDHIVWFDLLTADGTVIRCCKEQHADLFWQTCGGMGWTGIVQTVRFRLMKIRSLYMRQQTVHAANLSDLLDVLEQAPTTYAAAWIDGTARRAALGRGIVFQANHLDDDRINPQLAHRLLFPKVTNVPFFAPNGLLNRWSIAAYNAWYRFRNPAGDQDIDFNSYFYPLDQLSNWNRLYGPRGFVQYQFCIPKAVARKGLSEILTAIADSADRPFLSVLKRHGPRWPEAIHSFPIEGFSLALDFPKTTTVFTLVQQLDQLLDQYGGKIYLAKDACSASHLGRVDPRTFGDIKFQSLLKRRILNGYLS